MYRRYIRGAIQDDSNRLPLFVMTGTISDSVKRGLIGVYHMCALLDTESFADMATAAELTRIVDKLEERVNNHIKFGGAAVGLLFLWLAGISAALYHMNGVLSGIQSALAPQKISQAATAPSLPSSKKAVAQTLEQARKTGTPIPVQVIADAGVNFARASKADPTACPVALDLINYRSYLNTLSIAIPEMVPIENLKTVYHFSESPPPGRKNPEFNIPYGVAVPIGLAAILEPLGLPSPNADNAMGNPVLFGHGGYMSLDGMHLRHVLLVGVEIHYSGKPLLMEDVVFLDCTFVMDNTEPSRDLALAIASGTKVKFAHT